MLRRPGLAVFLGGLGAICFTHACSSEEEQASGPQCTPLTFRACLNPEGVKGLEQCEEPGVWTGCVPSVYGDAAYADVDAAPEDAADDGDGDGVAEDASDAADVSEDSEADAEDAGLLDSSE
jgi:hypothetical protein